MRSELNPHIEFEKSAFVVNRELRAWERPVVDGRESAADRGDIVVWGREGRMRT